MPDFPGRLKTPRLAAAPSSPTVGEMYYNTGSNKLFWWNGTSWIDASGGTLPTPIPDANLPGRLQQQALYVANLNTCVQSGWYRGDTSTANIPVNQGNWLVETISWDANVYCVQTAHYLYDTSRWFRWCNNNNWSAWQKVWPIDDATLPVRLGSSGAAVTDWNTISTNGWYIGSGASNAPPSPSYNYWMVMVTSWQATQHCCQLATALFEGDIMYFRR